MRRITKKQVEKIVETIQDWTDYEIEVNGYRDYDITPTISDKDLERIRQDVNKILNPKRWWRRQ